MLRSQRKAAVRCFAVLVFACAVSTSAPAAAALPANSLSYGYDAAGRLVTVIDPSQTNGVARYAYDAAGNVTGITRSSSSSLSIVQVSPGNGVVGTQVIIFGTVFSSTPSSDTVKFNGTAATVTAATTTAITTSVPVGATSGNITVKVGTTTVTSPSSFTVGPAGTPPPTISGLSAAVGLPGTAMTISGSNFSTTAIDDVVQFNPARALITSATAGSLGVTVPDGAISGRVAVSTAEGSASSATDFFVPPAGFLPADVLATGRIAMPALDGTTSQPVSIATTGKLGLYVFDATAGQRVFINITGSTMQESVSLRDTTGAVLASVSVGASGSIDATTIPITGTYEIEVQAINNTTGSLTLGLTNVKDFVGTITPTQAGSASSVSLAAPGDTATYTFTGSAGQRIAWKFTNVAITTAVTVYDPNGATVVSGLVYSFGTWLETGALPSAGTYKIVFDPAAAATGTVTMTSYNVPVDSTHSITIGGAGVTNSNTTPGQNIRFTFTSPSAGKKVTVTLSAHSTISSGTLSIRNTSTWAVVASTTFPSVGGTLNATLPSAVGYTVLVDPDTSNVGSVTTTLANGTFALTNPGSGGPPLTERSVTPLKLPRFTPSEAARWSPQLNDLSRWTTEDSGTPFTALPTLTGPAGATGVSGRVLLPNGTPLRRVTLTIGNRVAHTDRAGRFLLANLKPGHHVMVIDGSSADGSGSSYGIFEDGVDLKAGRTNVLPYTIWMPVLDTTHAVHFSYPLSHALVIKTPQIPGLEVKIPAGSVIRDRTGQRVTSLSITPIPTNRPPFPLPPGVYVPTYFTVQPGASYVMPTGARIIYPNYTGAAAGTRVQFWNYDPDVKGWYVYGKGTVTKNGKQVVPDPGVRIWEFTGAMINVPGMIADAVGDLWDKLRNKGSGDPVSPGTGLFTMNKTDLYEPGPLPLTLTRTYRQGSTQIRPFGLGETFPYAMFMHSNAQYDEADLVLPNSSKIHYVRTSACPTPGQVPCNDFVGAVFQAQSTPSDFYGSTISWNGNGWNLRRLDGLTYVFGLEAPLQAIIDRHGNKITIQHANGQSGNVTQVTGPSGRWIKFSYNSSNCPTCISDATDQSGRTTHYVYDSQQRLTDVTDVNGGNTHYSWNNVAGTTDQISAITDPRNIIYLQNQYDANDRIHQQTLANNGTFTFDYTLNGNVVTQTDVTDPDGNVNRYGFNADGALTSETDGFGTPIAQTTTLTRTAQTDRITDVVDQRQRDTHLTYDPATGDVTSVSQLNGTANVVPTNYTYDPAYDQVATIKDPLNHTNTFGYDSSGNLTDVTNALGKKWHLDYNSFGEPTAVTDPLTDKSTLTYRTGDLIGATDPLGNFTQRSVDSAGRVTGTTDAMGQKWRYVYDAAGNLKQIADPFGNLTKMAYDGNGDELTVTDPRNNVTTFTYNAMGAVATRQDSAPTSHTASYGYDLAGNETSLTDRRGIVTGYSYDALNRQTQTCFNQVGQSCGSTVALTFDDGNRLTKVVDSTTGSPSGTIDRTYDGLDELLTEVTTPQGASSPRSTITYTYDNAGRRATMQLSGQTQLSYGYDNADRMTSVTQGATNVGETYDDAGQLLTSTLPDGIVETYTYAEPGEIAAITDKLGATTIGTLQYAYNADGGQIGAGGTLARVTLPAAFSGSYDSANRLTNYTSGGVPATLTYDENGNLQSDGTNTYTWDARNHLAAVGGQAATSFAYDGFNRRIAVTSNGQTQEFVYDGANVAQEQNGSGSSVATLLTGQTDDLIWARTDSTGQASYLTDRLGSTVSLADSAGIVQTSYTYTPYGLPSQSGAASSNSFQYVGRQNDASTGLMYDRSRYYSPVQQRFISQDPTGFASDANLYRYVEGDPISLRDPLGTGVVGPCLSIGTLLGALTGSEQGCLVHSGTGQWGVTWTTGGGTGGGECAVLAGGVTQSNATYIEDQGGTFHEGTICAGAGVGGKGDLYWGHGACGQPIVGSTSSAGAAEGAGGAVQVTRTSVWKFWGPDDPCSSSDRKMPVEPGAPGTGYGDDGKPLVTG